MVAAEVRKLVERSVDSTGSISVIITGVQDETNATIMATEQSTKQAREVSGLMASTATLLEESIQATQRQKSAADQVDGAIQQIREAADGSRRGRRAGPTPPHSSTPWSGNWTAPFRWAARSEEFGYRSRRGSPHSTS